MSSQMAVKESLKKFANQHLPSRYVTTEEIAAGWFGSVWKIEDKEDPSTAKVVKISKLGKRVGTKNGRSYDAEVAVMRMVEGSSLFPRIFEHFLLKDSDKEIIGMIVMEKLGESVGTALKKKKNETFSFNNCMKIGRKVVDGLDYLHRCGVLHRDLHENNIAFSIPFNQDPLVKILDFGTCGSVSQFDDNLGFKTPSVDFSQILHSSLATNWNMNYDARDEYESWFYLLLIMLDKFSVYHNMEGMIDEKLDLHLAPRTYLNDDTLLKIWTLVEEQTYDKHFDSRPLTNYLESMSINYSSPLEITITEEGKITID